MTPHGVGWDRGLFYLINDAWTAPVLDLLMTALSLAANFAAIWLVLLGAIAVFGGRTGRTVALAGLLALSLGHFASDLLKELTVRPRPLASLPDVQSLVAEPSSYAFPSGHATSAFSATTGLLLATRGLLPRVPLSAWGLLFLAAAISYSRVYVGVHYPTDVLAGACLGTTCGWIGARCALGIGSRPVGPGLREGTDGPGGEGFGVQ